MTLKEYDALDKLVGVMHFLDGLGALLCGEPLETPVIEKTVVDPVLVDGPRFEKEGLVKPLDDLPSPFMAYSTPFAA